MVTSILNSATSGLKTAQGLLHTTSRNITHSGTAGYTKKLQQSEVMPLGGAKAGGIQRAVSEFLVSDLRRVTSELSRSETLTAALKRVDALSGDPAQETALANRIEAFGNALQDLTVEPGASVAYENAIQVADRLAGTIREANSALRQIERENHLNRNEDVTAANELLEEIASLNLTISQNTTTGRDITDYEDRRDALVLELSEIMEVRTFTNSRGVLNVFSADFRQLADERGRRIELTENDEITVGNDVIEKLGGSLGGYADIDSFVENRRTELDLLAYTMARAFAEEMDDGGPETVVFTTDGIEPPGDAPGDHHGFAGSIRVRDALYEDPTGLRGLKVELDDAGNPVLDGNGDPVMIPRPVGDIEILVLQREIMQGEHAFVDGNDLEVGYRGIFNSPELRDASSFAAVATEFTAFTGNEVRRSERTLQEAGVRLDFVQSEIGQISDVNIDTEMARMITLQQLYSASARVITTTQRMMDDLMNAMR